VDGLIATGAGAGGHCGKISTMVLIPYLRRETNLPIIAAGGIGTGSQMAAAFTLGASGVVIGTRLIATPEASSSSEYKQAVVDALPEDIVFTDRITGNVASWIGKSIEVLDTPTDPFAKEWKNLWSAGQSVAQVKDVMPAGEIIAEMIKEYEEVISDMPIIEG
jgi:nitronate monooxygenase